MNKIAAQHLAKEICSEREGTDFVRDYLHKLARPKMSVMQVITEILLENSKDFKEECDRFIVRKTKKNIDFLKQMQSGKVVGKVLHEPYRLKAQQEILRILKKKSGLTASEIKARAKIPNAKAENGFSTTLHTMSRYGQIATEGEKHHYRYSLKSRP